MGLMSHPSTDATRWLSAEEQMFWRRWMEVTTLVGGAIEHDLKESAGLNSGDYEVLVRLSEAPDRRLRMSELAAQAIHSPSRLSMRVDRLAKLGLVTRARCPEDGRGLFAVLTDAGFDRLAQAAPDHVASVRAHLVDRLTPAEIGLLSQVLARLVERSGENARLIPPA